MVRNSLIGFHTIHPPICFLFWCSPSAPTGVFDCLQGRLCKADNKCISYSQWCDGVLDCQSGEDEAHCCKNSSRIWSIMLNRDRYTIRWCLSLVNPVYSYECACCVFTVFFFVVVFAVRLYGSNSLLQMYSNVRQKWEYVCSDRWNDNLGKQACEEIGYER